VEAESEELAPHLQEFIEALKEEIEAAKRNLGGNAALLSDGRLIAPVGAGFHYRFQSQRPLRVPPDTPGFLAIPGASEDLPVSVVSIEDLSVVLELPKHIGGSIAQAKLKTDLTMLLLKLIERIETKGVDSHPAADRVLGFRLPLTQRKPFVAQNDRLNAEQRLAVESVLGSDTVFIWGPPGTGKTQTIGEIGTQLFRNKQTLLIASHTNTAVDEALIRIAKALDGEIKEGDVLRLGEPVKSELQARPDLILKRVAEKRSAELEAQKRAAEHAKTTALTELEALHRKVDICEWLAEADDDLAAFEARETAVSQSETEIGHLQKIVRENSLQSALWNEKRTKAEATLRAIGEQRQAEDELGRRRDQLADNHRSALEYRTKLKEAEALLALAIQAEPVRIRALSLPSLALAHSAVSQAQTRANQEMSRLNAGEASLASAIELLGQTSAVGAIKRMWLKLPKPEEQQIIVSRLEKDVERLRALHNAAAHDLGAAKAQMSEVVETSRFLEPFATVPRQANLESLVQNLQSEIASLDAVTSSNEARVLQLEKQSSAISAAVARFTDEFGALPDDVLAQVNAALASDTAAKQRMTQLQREVTANRRALADDLSKLISALAAWGLCDAESDHGRHSIVVLREAKSSAQLQVGHHDLASMVTERDRMSATVSQLIAEIRLIEEALKKVEAELLANVRVLATTLTRTFMREGIQQRGFDTVLIDEASMAPIPALWAAATLAERCVVAVGDFKQLSPIVQSEHPIAERWLGRDIFAASGVQGAWERGSAPQHFVALREQHRMHPDVSAIVNELIYNGLLRDGSSVTLAGADAEIDSWHHRPMQHSDRVMIVDTVTANAWNTTSDKSRFNLLSAMMSMELVRQWLSSSRPQLSGHDAKRILVICPYRPQAKLLDLMVREDGIEVEVAANTAHSFQGSEADAVILDLVVDEPHYNANLLTPAASADIARLLNVAITRAKRKICILADLSWFRAKGRGAFVGGSLFPMLCQWHQPVDALTVFSGNGFSDGIPSVIGHEHAVRLLAENVASASQQVVIFSPSLDPTSVSQVLRLAAKQGRLASTVFVVTRPVFEVRNTFKDQEAAEALLRDSGVRIIHKAKMLDKMVFIDQAEVWASTFSLLGTPQQGFALRRQSRKFATELRDFCYIEKLLEPYISSDHRCPICDKEMLAADSKSEKPFYWRCTDDGCYTRDLDMPQPVDGMLSFKCGSQPEFGHWGEAAHWLCTCGQKPSHRTKIHRNHLKLPKMRALIPKRSWNKVCRDLGLDPDAREQGMLHLE
jgi:hypothetical protein